MKIEHIAIWVQDLEKMRSFYVEDLGGISGAQYHNPTKNFTSYFISFNEGARLELMHRPDIPLKAMGESIGITHLAFSLGSREGVDKVTEKLRDAQYTIVGEPRTTGDGYYESVILDPEGNRIELTE